MTDYNHLNHTTWECKYHVVFIPKYRKKALFGKLRKQIGAVFHDLASRKDSKIEIGYIMKDHIHMLIEIPPKYSVSTVIGYLKGNSSRLMRKEFEYLRRRREMWSVGYFVSSVGANESVIRRYIQYQEKQDLGQAVLVEEKKPRAK